MATALAFGAWFDGPSTGFVIAISMPLVWASFADWFTLEIPDTASLSVAAMGVLYALFSDLGTIWIQLVAGVLTFVAFWALGEVYFRIKAHEGFGIGDAKLIAASVTLLGPQNLPFLLLLASVGGIIAILLQNDQKSQKSLERVIPFGPFIAYATFVVSLV